jgi:DNA relaxase NicK
MRFDAYSATIEAYPSELVSSLLERLDLAPLSVERERGKRNYAFADVIRDRSGETVAMVLHGGMNGPPHIAVAGDSTPAVVEVIRACWPSHQVTRVDVALDFDGVGTWERLREVVLRHAVRAGLVRREIRDPVPCDRDMQGRTLYAGSRKSYVMIRLYEKGKELVSKRKVLEGQIVSLDYCRLEIEVKLKGRQVRGNAAMLQPEQFWGFSGWAGKLLHEINGLDVKRVHMTRRKETDARRSLRAMARQYRPCLESVVAEEGGDDAAIMRLIREMWAEDDEFVVQVAAA